MGHDFYRNDDTLELREVVPEWWQQTPTVARDVYIAENPNMIILAGLEAVWEELDVFPEDSDYWLRDEHGEIVFAWGRVSLNLNHADVLKRIIDRAVSVSQCGLYDDIFLMAGVNGMRAVVEP